MEAAGFDESESRVSIVGIGASAGGLDALSALVRGVTPASTAFVIVQHQLPDHESLLPGLLERATRMPVREVVSGVRLEANTVYVAPPEADLALRDGVLVLAPPTSLPIDAFFGSLARELGPAAVGVVLSGLGSDGTAGLGAIKERGGLTFCQDPASTRFNAMPQSAIDAGVADRVLAPNDLGRELSSLWSARERSVGHPQFPSEDLAQLFELLRSAFGNDLSLYKPTTVTRRIERRMLLCKLQTLAEYVAYAAERADELRALYRDILISVTSFFRDVQPFELIEKELLPTILERKHPGDPVRLWAPACATGEEAYSLAMCLLDAVDASGKKLRLQVFGTDVDEVSIERARTGNYPDSIVHDVSPSRLARFFTPVKGGYRVSRRVRDLLVFSTQNVAQDPPFSRLDLVSCRNVLIYLQPVLQKRVIRILHYSLNRDGFLLLGNSETIGASADLFSLSNRKLKVYVKKNLPTPIPFDTYAGGDRQGAGAPSHDVDRRLPMTAQQLADRKVLERFAPPSVLVNENMEVLQFRGDTGPFLSPASGAATLQLLKLLRPELHLEVRRAVGEALEKNVAVRLANLRTEAFDGDATFGLSVIPIVEPETKNRCILIVFELQAARTEPRATPVMSAPLPPDVDRRVTDLEEELKSTKEYLQTAIEELEASNEELKSTNEELQSSNEELQSTNEELETSKEELQSANEELSSVNDENQLRMTEASLSKADLSNLLTRVDSAVVFLGGDLRVRRITDHARIAFGLSPNDHGRTLAQLNASFGQIDLEATVRRAIERIEPTTANFRSPSGRWQALKAYPYRTADNRIEGAILIARDIHDEKERQELVLNVEDYAGKLLAAIPNPLAIVDDSLRVLWVNEPFLAYFRTNQHETIGNLMQNLGNGQWGHPRLRSAMDETLATGNAFRDFEIRHEFEGIGSRNVRVSGSRIENLGEAPRVLLLTIEDIPHKASGSETST